MHPDRLAPRPARTRAIRAASAAVALASLTALTFAAVTTLSAKAKAELAGRYARRLAINTVSNIEGLVALFRTQQAQYLRIAPPAPDFTLRQWCGTIPFDPNGFPQELLKGLIEAKDKGCPVVTVVVAEDPTTREIVFADADGHEVYAIPAAKDYDPWWVLNSLYPDLASGAYSAAQIDTLKSCYDPAHIQMTVTLLPVEYIDAYAAEMAEALTPSSGGGTPMMRYSGPAVTNLQFTAIEGQTNGVRLTLAYPGDFTNRVDFFSCANLAEGWWDLAATTNVNSSTNWIEWLDISQPDLRLYAAGNADTNATTDPDGDGLTWAREVFLYHSSPTNYDTDNDGLSDYTEAILRHTDPTIGGTNPPIAVFVFPSNDTERVWMP